MYRTFFKSFLRQPLKNASVIPSSIHLTKAMFSGISFENIQCVVELGAGTGCFTQEIINRLYPNAKLLTIDIEPCYIQLLQKKFGHKNNVIIVQESAESFPSLIQKHNLPYPDLIISGLPFSINKKIRDILCQNILDIHEQQSTKYRTFTYFPFIFKKIYKDLPLEKKNFTRKNFPPAEVRGLG